jgi:hypothetical protein
MADLQSNFVIAITSMTLVSVVLVGVPLVIMLARPFRAEMRLLSESVRSWNWRKSIADSVASMSMRFNLRSRILR